MVLEPLKIDGLVKSCHSPQAGIHGVCTALKRLDSRFHGNDGKRLFGLFTKSSKLL